ncbi:hypothetical protein [Archangium lansingense]|uniref:Uncharacterized protein n=2 Tax=Archangium lansingense TaxID=2995310 RepID=A0ABT3ZYP8_9BACT|nr:hypothetical protein [Archangium lansinium]MCY1074532.1 hypothetical protein [Archangium lansinium]
MAALCAAMQRRFTDRLMPHLRRLAPAQTRSLDDAALRAVAEAGLARAAGHGITTEWDLCRFVLHHLRLGSGFETDPRFAWARDILARNDLDGRRKLDRLDYHYFHVLMRHPEAGGRDETETR